MTTERKVFIGIGVVTIILLVGGIFLLSNSGSSSSKTLMGQAVPITGRTHFPQGTPIKYSTNPPAEGNHYPNPQPAGIYPTPPPDGNLVHSLEHGAVILWYNPKKLSSKQIDTVKNIFNKAPGDKDIMVARTSMDVPLALTSWGRILKLNSIDEKTIDAFFNANVDQGPEQAPL